MDIAWYIQYIYFQIVLPFFLDKCLKEDSSPMILDSKDHKLALNPKTC